MLSKSILSYLPVNLANRANLKSREDAASYSVPEQDLKRLDLLNSDMLAIRKTVYDMEVDGSSMTLNNFGMRRTPSKGFAFGMYKIELMEKKQNEILADLLDAERSASEPAQSSSPATGTKPFGYRDFAAINGNYSAQSIIESFQKRGVEISQSEAEELLAFELELGGR